MSTNKISGFFADICAVAVHVAVLAEIAEMHVGMEDTHILSHILSQCLPSFSIISYPAFPFLRLQRHLPQVLLISKSRM